MNAIANAETFTGQGIQPFWPADSQISVVNRIYKRPAEIVTVQGFEPPGPSNAGKKVYRS